MSLPALPCRWLPRTARLLLLCIAAVGGMWGESAGAGGTPPTLLQGAAQAGMTTSTSTCHNWTSPPNTDYKCQDCPTQVCGTVDCPQGSSTPVGNVDNTNLDETRESTDAAPASDLTPAGPSCPVCGGGSAQFGDIARLARLPSWQVRRILRPSLAGTHSSLGPGGFLDLDASLTFTTASGAPAAIVFFPQQHAPISLVLSGTTFVDQQYASCRGLQLFDAASAATTVPGQAATAVLTTWDGLTYTFEIPPSLGQGRLVRTADRNGNAITIAYALPVTAAPADPSLLWEMASSTDAYGRITTYDYGATPISGSYPITRITTPDGQVTRYQYGGGGLTGLSGISHPDGTSSWFATRVDATTTQCQIWSVFDASSRADQRRQDYYLSLGEFVLPGTGEIIDVAPNRVRMVANGAGEVAYLSWATLTPQFDQQLYVYEGGQSLYRFTTFLGQPVCTERATSWDLSSDASAWSWTLDRAYRDDADKYFIAEGDGLGRTTQLPLDLTTGGRTGATYPDGSSVTTTYNQFREPLQRTDELGRLTTWTYDANGNCLSETVAANTPAAATTAWTYNGRGQPLTRTDANGHTTAYGYDALGQLIHLTEPPDVAGGPQATWTFAYDPAGNHVQTVDPEGRVVTYAYDARNRLTVTTYPDGSTETRSYGTGGDANLLVASTDRNGNLTQYIYDGAGREISRTVGAGTAVADTIATTYLPGTKLPDTVVQFGDTTSYAYDYSNRLLATTTFPTLSTALVTTEARDQTGQDVISTDPYGRRTERAYDVRGRVIRTAEEMVPGALASTEDLIAALPDPGQQPWTFQSLGSPAVPGSISIQGGEVSITDQGIEMWSDTEQFSLYDQTLVGDGSITCRVVSQQNTDPWAKAGIMIRSADAVGAAYAALFTSPGYGVSVNDRASTGLDTTYEPVYAAQAYPPSCWLRLVRQGTNILSYTSPDGTSWTLVNQTTVGGGAAMRVGLFVLAHETTVPCTAVFDSITVELAPTQSDLTLLALTQQYVQGLVRGANPQIILTDAEFDAASERVASTDGRGIMSTQSYDGQGRAVQRTAAAGTSLAATTTYQYDPVGNIIAVKDPLGRVSIRSYSERNLLLSRTDAAGLPEALTKTYTYTLTQKVETTTTPLGTTTYSYAHCCDRLIGITDEAGYLTGFTYDPYGNRTSMTDGNGITTVMAYDSRNRLASSTDGSGETTTFLYDDHINDGGVLDATYGPYLHDLPLGLGADGSAILTTDPLGHTSLQVKDGIGRPLRMLDGLEHATTTTYDVVVGGLVDTEVQDPQGDVTQQLRDARGRTIAAVDASGFITTMVYDTDNNLINLRDPNGVGDDWQYDMLNRRVLQIDTVGATTEDTYDLVGNLLSEVDALGHATTHGYDGLNRQILTTDRIGTQTRFTYDPVGNLRTIMDAQGGVTAYAYDPRSLLVRESFPGTAGGIRSYTYDGGRRLTSRTDQTGLVTTYTYDLANRLIQRGYPDGLNDTFAYDHAGRLLQAKSGRYVNTTTRVYDAANRLTNEGLVVVADPIVKSTVRYDVFYGYDNANRLTLLSYPDGTQALRTYTPRGELATVTYNHQPVATRSYDAGGRLISSVAGNGLHETRTYRLDNLVQTITVPDVTDFTYSYDADKRTLEERDQVLPQQTQRFSYDAEGRLVSWQEGGAQPVQHQTWDLSPVGDWQTTTINGVVQRRTHNAVHEITSIDGRPVTSDPKGNLVHDPLDALQLGWDPENRLTQALSHGTHATYSYDALGRRVQKMVDGLTTTFVNAEAQDIWETDTNQNVYNPIEANGGPATPNRPIGGVLTGAQVLRIAFEPASAPVPAGFDADTGAVLGRRSDGNTYGWVGHAQPFTSEYDIEPLPPFNGNDAMQMAGQPNGTWQLQLSDGSYPVILVMGDAEHRDMTNDVSIGGVPCTDPDPDAPQEEPGYEQGRFVGYAVQVQVQQGSLRIQPLASAVHARICFLEIGVKGTGVDAAVRSRLQALVQNMTQATANIPPKHGTRATVFGTYVDEALLLTTGKSRLFFHANRVFSIAALSNAAGQMTEQYRYDAYGHRAVLNLSGMPTHSLAASSTLGFTGRPEDNETSLLYFRARYLEPVLGRFISRDPVGYTKDITLYEYCYSNPGLVDPIGHQPTVPPGAAPNPTPPLPPPAPNGVPYDPGPWNQNAIQNSNNCYSYACNDPLNHPYGSKPQPGSKSGHPWYADPLNPTPTIDCATITRAAISDGLVQTNCNTTCPCGSYKVMLVTTAAGDPNSDYHWYRQDLGGSWSNKPGHGPASNLDDSGKPIQDPSTANRNGTPQGNPNYTNVCGCFCVPNSGIATAP